MTDMPTDQLDTHHPNRKHQDTAPKALGAKNGAPVTLALTLAATWLAFSIPLGVLIGRAIAAADRAATTTARAITNSCPCGTCAR